MWHREDNNDEPKRFPFPCRTRHQSIPGATLILSGFLPDGDALIMSSRVPQARLNSLFLCQHSHRTLQEEPE